MTVLITDNESTAARRRIPLILIDDTTGAAWAGSVIGVKAMLSINGGAEVASTADIVRVAGIQHYVELTQAEANRTPGDTGCARVPAVAGRREWATFFAIPADDSYAAAPTDASISTATRDALIAISDGRAWGVTTMPVGGSSQTLQVRNPGGAVVGDRTALRDVDGNLVGLTAVV